MSESEGIVKYRLNHTQRGLQQNICLTGINTWRSIMHRLRLIGQHPDKYAGCGFGNISQRVNENSNCFLISGTQTGHSETLTRNEYCLVIDADLNHNSITSAGPCKPSSEALTHAMVYRQNQQIQCIIHAHCPEIWHNTSALNLPFTAEHIPYGTVAMAQAVEQLFRSGQLASDSLFTMLGHEDGVIAFGTTMRQTAEQLIHYLANALAIAQEEFSR